MKNKNRRGLMLVISAPSGAGKTTLSNLLLKLDHHLYPSISYTTRPMRSNEVDGQHYFFTNKATFLKMVESEEFIEYAEVFGEYYGTPRKFVEEKMQQGEDFLFDLDFQGTRQLVANARKDVVTVFILPPSKQELLARLRSRGENDEASIKTRLHKADEEMSHWNEYDYTVINRDIDDSLKKIIAILRAERLKKSRRLGVGNFVHHLLTEAINFHHN
jgi:guanylate kinase